MNIVTSDDQIKNDGIYGKCNTQEKYEKLIKWGEGGRKPEGKRPFKRLRRMCENNVKIDLKQMELL
jgi:hypothetical protein